MLRHVMFNILRVYIFSMGTLYEAFILKHHKWFVPASEFQRSHRRVTCWADVTLGAVILNSLKSDHTLKIDYKHIICTYAAWY